VTISSCLDFGRPALPGRGSAARGNFFSSTALPYDVDGLCMEVSYCRKENVLEYLLMSRAWKILHHSCCLAELPHGIVNCMEPVDSTVHVYMGNPALVSLCVSKPTSFIGTQCSSCLVSSRHFIIWTCPNHLNHYQPRARPGYFIGARPKADSGSGCWEGAASPSPPVGGLGERRELPSGVWGGAPTARRFSTIFSTQDGLDPDTIMLLMWTVMQLLGGGDPRASPPPPPLCWPGQL